MSTPSSTRAPMRTRRREQARPRVNLTKARGEQTRELILTEATALFAVYGYRGTSLRDISERVGISHPGMLHHFPHKESLLLAVIDRAAQGYLQVVKDFCNCRSFEEIKAWQSSVTVEATLVSVLMAEIVDEEHPGREPLLELRAQVESIVADYFRSVQSRGDLADGVTPDFAARMLVVHWMGAFLRERLTGDQLYDDDLGQCLRMLMPRLREQD